MMYRLGMAIALLAASAAAHAAGPAAVRKQVEASMLVTGKIEVDADGKVGGWSLDRKDKLPVGVVSLIEQSIPGWRFEPVVIDGKATNVATDMSIRLVAKKIDKDNYTIGIRSAGFGARAGKPEERVRGERLSPPGYPEDAIRAGVAGTVYLLVKVGRDGKVVDAVAEQVNLKLVDDDRTMERWRRVLADASVGRARRWSFLPPTQGEEVGLDSWVMRVPVVFSLDESPQNAYGRWEAYVPGQRQPNPWGDSDEGNAFSPDALVPGAAYLAGAGLKLVAGVAGSDG